MFRRRSQAAAARPSDTDPNQADAARPESESSAGPAVAAALTRAAPLWADPRPGEVQRGVAALCGDRVPESLIGLRLRPIPTRTGPSLLLVDDRNRLHVAVDIAQLPSGRPVRPEWVATTLIAHTPRLSGSHPLWRHWHPELSAYVPHPAAPMCDNHAHLARPNAHGQLVAGIPAHDAWVMSRSWVPAELVVPSTTDVRWVVLSASDRPLREREPAIRSIWDVVSFAELTGVLRAHYEPAAPPSVAELLRLLPVEAATD